MRTPMEISASPRQLSRTLLLPVATLLAVSACEDAPDPGDVGNGSDGEPPVASVPSPSGATILDLLQRGETVIGIQSGEHTAEQGSAILQAQDADFVFYSLESGPWDMDALEAYRAGMEEGIQTSGGELAALPILLRIPPIRDLGEEEARARVREGLERGVAGIVYPHVMSREEAEIAGDALGGGDRVNVLLIEDPEVVERAGEIVTAPGAGVIIPAPGDLGRAFDGDEEATEEAIQRVLAVCLEHGVPCGITAGVDDIGERIEQGFRFFIVRDPEAVEVGLAAAGR